MELIHLRREIFRYRDSPKNSQFWEIFDILSFYSILIVMTVNIHPSWYTVLALEFEQPYWKKLTDFIKSEYSTTKCFPPGKNIFRAFELTHFDDVRVVVLGQDPYHTAWAAMGMAFSIPDGSRTQPSLRNILQELHTDTWVQRIRTDLTDWAEQWVLLINTALTVREWEPASHSWVWWEQFTDRIIELISAQREGIVFVLWGSHAIVKRSLIDPTRHHIIESSHPSPFSAHRGFFGSRPFSRTNQYLREQGVWEIFWG